MVSRIAERLFFSPPFWVRLPARMTIGRLLGGDNESPEGTRVDLRGNNLCGDDRLWISGRPLPAQRSQGPRTAAKRPNLNGIWQAMNSANWDLEAHPARASLIMELGAIGGTPAGQSVVEGGAIPYRPEVLARKKENFANRLKADPEVMCFLPGIPRATYMPYPFQIIQSQDAILMAYEHATPSELSPWTAKCRRCRSIHGWAIPGDSGRAIRWWCRPEASTEIPGSIAREISTATNCR